MFQRIKLLCVLIAITDLVLLGVMVHYTSWPFMLSFVFLSGIVGAWLLNDGLRRYLKKAQSSAAAEAMSADVFLLGAAARLAAGVLFIFPGLLTDLLALLLISPAGKRLLKFFIKSLFANMFPHLSNPDYFSRPSGEIPAKDKIIDVQIINGDDKEAEDRR